MFDNDPSVTTVTVECGYCHTEFTGHRSEMGLRERDGDDVICCENCYHGDDCGVGHYVDEEYADCDREHGADGPDPDAYRDAAISAEFGA